MNQYQALIEQVFKDLFDPEKDEKVLKPYFADSYTQWVDGKLLDYEGFFQHVKTLKEVVSSAHIEFIEYLEKDDTVADIHDVFVTKKDGEKLHIRVMAFFSFKNQKITSVRELTQLLSGNNHDENIGSRLS